MEDSHPRPYGMSHWFAGTRTDDRIRAEAEAEMETKTETEAETGAERTRQGLCMASCPAALLSDKLATLGLVIPAVWGDNKKWPQFAPGAEWLVSLSSGGQGCAALTYKTK